MIILLRSAVWLASWRDGAGADDEFRGEQESRACLMVAVDPVDDQAQRPLAELVEILPHGGERRQEELRFRDVVESDHADIIRNPDPPLIQRPQQAEGHLILGAEHRRHPRRMPEPLPPLLPW